VADPGCLSRIPDSDFYPSRISDPGSRIPDPKTATKERGEKKFVVITFYVASNFTKLHIILVLCAEEKNLGQFSKNYRTFYTKIVNKLSKIWIWDPGSRGQKGTGSRIRIRNTG
jgi:hypothetical protein